MANEFQHEDVSVNLSRSEWEAAAAHEFDAGARGHLLRQGASNLEGLALGNAGELLTSDGTDAVWLDPSGWTVVDATRYTATPASTTVLTVSDTGGPVAMLAGLPARYTIGGIAYCGVIYAVSVDSDIEIAGPTLGGDVTLLEIGVAEKVIVREFRVDRDLASPWLYGDDVETSLFASDLGESFIWGYGKAYIVHMRAFHLVNDSGTEAKCGVYNIDDAAQVFTVGVTLATTWAEIARPDVIAANYDINFGEQYDISCITAGQSGDAQNAFFQVIFVLA